MWYTSGMGEGVFQKKGIVFYKTLINDSFIHQLAFMQSICNQLLLIYAINTKYLMSNRLREAPVKNVDRPLRIISQL